MLSEQLGETPALGALRLVGLGHYQTAPLPERVDHLWRYSNPRSLLPIGSLLQLPDEGARSHHDRRGASPSAPVAHGIDALLDDPAVAERASESGGAPLTDAAAAVVLLPGREPRIALSDQAWHADLHIAPLNARHANIDQIGTAVPPTHGVFEALNAAAWSAGVEVRIPRGVVLEAPVRIVVPAARANNVPRVLIVLEEGAEATVVEEHVGGGPERFVVGVSEVFARSGSRLRYVLLEDWQPGVVGHLTQRLVIDRDAHALTTLTAFGGSRLKLDLGAELRGRGAHSEMVGFALGQDHQHLDLHTEHRHRAPNTWSNMDWKVALDDDARSAYTGLIRIDEGAANSEAFQEERNLLLSNRCRADAIPELEIMTNEVQCTHGATSSPVDDEHLFYLQSRGIEPAEAMRIVVRGFFESALRRLPVALRESVEQSIHQRLDGLTRSPRQAGAERGSVR